MVFEFELQSPENTSFEKKDWSKEVEYMQQDQFVWKRKNSKIKVVIPLALLYHTT